MRLTISLDVILFGFAGVGGMGDTSVACYIWSISW